MKWTKDQVLTDMDWHFIKNKVPLTYKNIKDIFDFSVHGPL